jgi:hypothetical protein
MSKLDSTGQSNQLQNSNLVEYPVPKTPLTPIASVLNPPNRFQFTTCPQLDLHNFTIISFRKLKDIAKFANFGNRQKF